MKTLFLFLYDFFESRRTLLWAIIITCFAVFTVLISRLEFDEDISGMLNIDEETSKFNTIVQSSHIYEKMVLLVSASDEVQPDRAASMAFADSLSQRLLKNDKGLIKNISLRLDEEYYLEAYAHILQNLPVFLEEDDYQHLDSLFTEDNLRVSLERQRQSLSSPMGPVIVQNLRYDPAGVAGRFLQRLLDFKTSSGMEISDGYLFSKDGRHLMFHLEPVNPANETNKNGILLSEIEKHIEELSRKEEFRDIVCRYFGSSAISVGNARQLQRDILITMLLAGVSLLVLLFIVFKKKRVPFIIILTIIFGGGFGLAAVSLIKTSVSLIAIGSGSVILGIVVHYPIHLLSHKLFESDTRTVIRGMVVPLTIGSLTTVGGFLCLLSMKAGILHDLGLFGAFSLIGSAIFTLIFCPHFIGDISKTGKGTKVRQWLTGFAGFSIEDRKIPIMAILLLTPVLLWFVPRIEFESDLLELNYMSDELKETESLINEIQGGSRKNVYVISYGSNREEALEKSYIVKTTIDSLKKAGLQSELSGIVSIIPPIEIQNERVERWNGYWNSERSGSAIENLDKISSELRFAPNAFSSFTNLIKNGASVPDNETYELLLSTFGSNFFSAKDSLFSVISSVSVTPGNYDLISGLLYNLEGNTVLNTSVLSKHLLDVINDDFNLLAILTASMVILALFLIYGRIELVMVTFIPMLIAWVWVIGLMAMMGIKFNLVNIVLSTFIFGLGDDFCIFIMDGMQQKNKTGRKHFTSLRIGIYLSSLTAIIGFGVLLFARHPALLSLAFVSLLGIGSVLIISQVLEPYFFNLLITKQQKKGRSPITISIILNSLIAFFYFVAGSVILSITGIVTYPLRLIDRRRVLLAYNWLLHKYTFTLVWIMSNVRKNYFGLKPDTFSKPSMLISNHQSVLDILLLITLHPKIILLTNKWVWNSPIFGLVVRLAGYHKIVQGVDEGLEKLSRAIEEGYSIGVFPEGTRSATGSLQRFHKGAFYLAEKLKVGITPVLLHGTGRTLRKGSFILRSETISVKILDTIQYDDQSYGKTYQERTKKISRYFRTQLQEFANFIETPGYYRNQLISGYIYKGPVLEWYLKVKLYLEKCYQSYHQLVPVSGRILDAGCGYGFISYMLGFMSPERIITGVDYDGDKIDVAANCYFKAGNVRFETANLTDYSIEGYDCIVFSDVLHYLTPGDRESVLTRALTGLNQGGSIIIRDGDKSMRVRHKGTRITELFSTRLCKFNMINNPMSFFSFNEIAQLAARHGYRAEITDNLKYTSNILILLTKAI